VKSAQKKRSEKRFCALFVYSVIKYYTFIITRYCQNGTHWVNAGMLKSCQPISMKFLKEVVRSNERLYFVGDPD